MKSRAARNKDRKPITFLDLVPRKGWSTNGQGEPRGFLYIVYCWPVGLEHRSFMTGRKATTMAGWREVNETHLLPRMHWHNTRLGNRLGTLAYMTGTQTPAIFVCGPSRCKRRKAEMLVTQEYNSGWLDMSGQYVPVDASPRNDKGHGPGGPGQGNTATGSESWQSSATQSTLMVGGLHSASENYSHEGQGHAYEHPSTPTKPSASGNEDMLHAPGAPLSMNRPRKSDGDGTRLVARMLGSNLMEQSKEGSTKNNYFWVCQPQIEQEQEMPRRAPSDADIRWALAGLQDSAQGIDSIPYAAYSAAGSLKLDVGPLQKGTVDPGSIGLKSLHWPIIKGGGYGLPCSSTAAKELPIARLGMALEGLRYSAPGMDGPTEPHQKAQEHNRLEGPRQAGSTTGGHPHKPGHHRADVDQQGQGKLSQLQRERISELHDHRVLYGILAALGIEDSIHSIRKELGIERVLQLALVTKEDLLLSTLQEGPRNILLGLLHGLVIDEYGNSVQGVVSWQGNERQKLVARHTSVQECCSQRPPLKCALHHAMAWAEDQLRDIPE
jgi:hypothetical protein